MPARSVASPINPPRASISLTRLPFARPPIAGLHDMRPIASRCIVIIATRAPPLAHTRAASAPAWPPPMTITSKRVSGIRFTWNNERRESHPLRPGLVAVGSWLLESSNRAAPRANSQKLLADAEPGKDLIEHIVARDRTSQHTERVRGALKIDEDHLLFHACCERIARYDERCFAFSDRRTLPLVHDCGRT